MPKRPTGGHFVVVVGPDGAGKTTVARLALKSYPGQTGYFHFAPPILERLDPGPPIADVAPPKRMETAGSVVGGWVRLARNFVRFWLGYLLRVRPAVRQGSLVIGDRWAYGYLVQPHALKYYGPEWLARVAIRLMPQPDVVVNIRDDADAIYRRKQELTLDQIATELVAWQNVPAPRVLTVSNPDGGQRGTAERVLAELGA